MAVLDCVCRPPFVCRSISFVIFSFVNNNKAQQYLLLFTLHAMNFLGRWFSSTAATSSSPVSENDDDDTTTEISTTSHQDQAEVQTLQLDYKVLSKMQQSALPKLPFTYSRKQPHLFISQTEGFLFACIITDLDLQLLKHIAELPANVSLDGVPLTDILHDAIIHSDSNSIQTFCDLFHIDPAAYVGMFNMTFQELLDKLECCAHFHTANCEKRAIEKKAEAHHKALYNDELRLV
jgi:hypothetical protein